MKIKILLVVSLIGLGIWWWVNRPNNNFKMVFCDVGQGDAALVVYGNFQMLIDAGPENRKVLNCLEDNLPFGDKQLELAVITHWDLDHAGGIRDVLNYYKIEKVFSGTKPEAGFEQINYTGNLKSGDVIKYGLMSFEILSTEGVEGKGEDEDNANSVVGVLSYKDYVFFMMGDAPLVVEQRLVWRQIVEKSQSLKASKSENLKVVLKVSHHGSDTATGEELLEAVKPNMAVVSVGKNNFGHPAEEVIKRLNERGIQILRTDMMGEIEFVISNQ
ncbi:MAG: MBL fold metallo-hydrolase [Candidatus Shapirobacteria bacterium]|jgi:competence protein ComEC